MKRNLNAPGIIFLIMGLVLTAGVYAGNEPNTQWELEKNENNIRVYTRYNKGSEFKEFKVETTVNGNIQKLSHEIVNIKGYPDWITDCHSTKILQEKESGYIYYIQFEAPWPVSSRDIVLEAKIEKEDEQTFLFTMEGMPKYIKKQKDIVRMPYFKGFWKLTQQDSGRVHIVHQVHAEPGGKLPSWLVNATTVDGPFKTISKLIGNDH